MNLIKRWAGLLAVAAGCTVCASSSATLVQLLDESFDDVATLSSKGWVIVNNSSPPGSTSWFQGNPAVFPSAAGPDDSYIAANFNSAALGGSIDNWLLTPVLALSNGEQLNFRLRLLAGDDFFDAVEVYASANGASTDVGGFLRLATYGSSFDTGWRDTDVSVFGLTAPASGRLAFRYVGSNTDTGANYIGIDSVNVSATAVPAPGTVALVVLGLCALAGFSRQRNRKPASWLALSGLALAATTAQAVPDDGVMTFPHVNVVAQQAPRQAAGQSTGGLKAYKDPVTGKLGDPTPEQAAALDAAIRASAAGPKLRAAAPRTIRPPHGGVGMVLDSSHAAYSVAPREAAKEAVQGEQK